jgi:hypothetical protein
VNLISRHVNATVRAREKEQAALDSAAANDFFNSFKFE